MSEIREEQLLILAREWLLAATIPLPTPMFNLNLKGHIVKLMKSQTDP
jgi:hypothetical protein